MKIGERVRELQEIKTRVSLSCLLPARLLSRKKEDRRGPPLDGEGKESRCSKKSNHPGMVVAISRRPVVSYPYPERATSSLPTASYSSHFSTPWG